MRRAIVLTIVLGLAGTGLAAAGGDSGGQREQARAADAAVKGFHERLAAFDAKQSKLLGAAVAKDVDNYARLLKVADRAVAQAPEVPTRGTTAYGREHSDDYRDAINERDGIVAPYETLARVLRSRAIPASKFIIAARAAVLVDPAKLLKDKVIATGEPLREFVVPAFKKARARLKKQAVPADAELLAADLLAFVDGAIRQTRDGADRIDEGKPFFFDFGTQPQDLLVRLTGLETQVAREVAVITGGISGGA